MTQCELLRLNRRSACVVATWLAATIPVVASGSDARDRPSSADVVAEDVDCGPRCAWFLIRCLGPEEIPLSSVIGKSRRSGPRQGTSLLGLREVLERHGVGARAVRVTCLEELGDSRPVILHLTAPLGSPAAPTDGDPAVSAFGGHYVVLVGGQGVLRSVWDGPNGLRRLAPEVIERAMSGLVLVPADAVSNASRGGSAAGTTGRMAVAALLFVGGAGLLRHAGRRRLGSKV